MENFLSAFKEHKPFKKEKPWDANIIKIPFDCVTPPHYAETIEVLLCCNVLGQITIGNHTFELTGNQAYFIPPNVIHSLHYKKSEGYVDVLKINLPVINSALNLDNLLSFYNLAMENMPIVIKDFELLESISQTFHNSKYVEDAMQAILKLFHFLIHDSLENNYSSLPSVTNNPFLQKVLDWTEKNFTESISLDEIAEIANYDKNYFCRKFKAETGIAYFTYIITLRVNNAVKMLKKGHSVDQACTASGFDNMEYFVQVFKKNIGVTPRKFLLSLKENSDS